jgi:hypothetical protein
LQKAEFKDVKYFAVSAISKNTEFIHGIIETTGSENIKEENFFTLFV